MLIFKNVQPGSSCEHLRDLVSDQSSNFSFLVDLLFLVWMYLISGIFALRANMQMNCDEAGVGFGSVFLGMYGVFVMLVCLASLSHTSHLTHKTTIPPRSAVLHDL